MAFQRANHYEVTGSGIEGTVDVVGFTGAPVVSLTVDGETVEGAALQQGQEGVEVTAVLRTTFDGPTTSLRLVLPDTNLDEAPASVDGYALLLTVLSSIGGPGLVRGAIQQYDLRPVTATASIVES